MKCFIDEYEIFFTREFKKPILVLSTYEILNFQFGNG